MATRIDLSKISFFNTWGGDYTVPKTEEGKRCWREALDRPEALTAGKGYDLVAPQWRELNKRS